VKGTLFDSGELGLYILTTHPTKKLFRVPYNEPEDVGCGNPGSEGIHVEFQEKPVKKTGNKFLWAHKINAL